MFAISLPVIDKELLELRYQFLRPVRDICGEKYWLPYMDIFEDMLAVNDEECVLVREKLVTVKNVYCLHRRGEKCSIAEVLSQIDKVEIGCAAFEIIGESCVSGFERMFLDMGFEILVVRLYVLESQKGLPTDL